MADDVVIRAEGLGKKYAIGHQAERERYIALRDVLARGASGAWRKARDLARGRAVIAGETIEEFWALRGLDFEVRRGEVLGIIGRNGAGKSTLLKILSRITEPSEGRVTIKGRVASLLEVGTGFHPELTGRENIYLNGAILGMSRAEIRRKFDEIVDFAGVERFLDTPVKRYSSGMHVRLAFAVAAHLEPEILLVDEVLAVGDAGFQRKCLGKIGEISQSGRTVLFVSHYMNAVELLCNRVMTLNHGRSGPIFDEVQAGIARYMSSIGNEEINPCWVRQDGEFDHPCFTPQLFAAATTAANQRPGEPFSNKYPIAIRAEGDLRTADDAFNLGVAIYTDAGELLFWSFIRDVPEEHWFGLTPGRVSLSVQIPARLLNEGTYRVELLSALHYSEWLHAPGKGPSLWFTVHGGLSDSPYWPDRRPGLLGPVLEWTLLPDPAIAVAEA